jgi:hypothetical protein
MNAQDQSDVGMHSAVRTTDRAPVIIAEGPLARCALSYLGGSRL